MCEPRSKLNYSNDVLQVEVRAEWMRRPSLDNVADVRCPFFVLLSQKSSLLLLSVLQNRLLLTVGEGVTSFPS